MAAGQQNLTVGIDADASGLLKATNQAAKALDGLKADVGALDAESVDVRVAVDADAATSELAALRGDVASLDGEAADLKVGVDAAAASRELEDLRGDLGTLDAESVSVPVEIEQKNIARDLGNLRKVLAGIEKQKASPDVDLDLTQLLRDEAKVKKAIDGLEKRKVDLSASISVDTSGLAGIQGIFTDLREGFEGGGGGGVGLIGGLGAASRGIAAIGAEGAAAATGVGALAVGLGTAGTKAWEFGQAAADVETSVAQLDALVRSQGGSGEKVFGDLQKWAQPSQFAIDDATDATKKLVAAGVPLKNLPAYLDQMGNTASATGVPLEQLATTFAQMESSGKASYENLQQLAEAGIPVWQTLSEKLDLSVAALQDMAIKGQLPVQTIKLLREELNNLYPTAMQDQSETFNGQMSTLKDNFDQVSQSLGLLFLPAMTDLVGLLSSGLGVLLSWTQGLAGFNESVRGFTGGSGLLEILSPTALGVKLLGDKFGGASDQAKALGTSSEKTLKAVQDSLAAATTDVAALQKAFGDAVQAFSQVGADVRLHVSFIISKAELEREIAKAAGGKNAVDLPANLNIRQLTGLKDKQFELIGSLSSWVEQGLNRGAEQANLAQQLGTKFDAAGFYAKMRKQLRPMLIDVGIDPKQVDRVMTNVFGVPKPVAVKPYVKDIDDARNKLDGVAAPRTASITPLVFTQPAESRFDHLVNPRKAPVTADANTGAATKELNGVAGPRTAPINGKANTGQADRDLDAVARDRSAHIKLVLDPSLYSHMNDRLDRLAASRTVTLTGGGGGGGAGAAPNLLVAGTGTQSLLSAATTLAAGPAGVQVVTAGGSHQASGQPAVKVERAVTHLSPKQTPVQVFLDGAVIADHVSLRTQRMAGASSVERSA